VRHRPEPARLDRQRAAVAGHTSPGAEAWRSAAAITDMAMMLPEIAPPGLTDNRLHKRACCVSVFAESAESSMRKR
jgi:hypothetical protein